jgi:hypothetical protein
MSQTEGFHVGLAPHEGFEYCCFGCELASLFRDDKVRDSPHAGEIQAENSIVLDRVCKDLQAYHGTNCRQEYKISTANALRGAGLTIMLLLSVARPPYWSFATMQHALIDYMMCF